MQVDEKHIQSLTLLHTNDVHGRVVQLARTATLVSNIRREVISTGGFCYYLDAGDCEDTTNLESAVTKGAASEAILSAAGCDQAALGNAIPLRYGAEAVEELARHFSKPLLCANLQDKNGNLLPGLAAYHIEKLPNFKLAFIGITAPFPLYQSAYGWHPVDPLDILPGIITEVNNKDARFVIVLSHCGSQVDIELAQKIEGINVIIGGHDHRFIEQPIQINKTLIVQAGNYAEALGRLDLTLDPRSSEILQFHGELLPVKEHILPDERTLHAIRVQTEQVNRLMQEKVGELPSPAVCDEDRECAAGNLLADALRDRVKDAQLAFVVEGHWNNGLEVGTITKMNLYSANRSAGNPARAVLSGAQIKQFLVNALKPENIQKRPHSLRGRAHGWPHVSGMRVVVPREKPEAMQILVQDRPISDTDRFVVAASDLEFSELLNYLPLPDEALTFEVPTIIPEVLEDYLKTKSNLSDFTETRIQFVQHPLFHGS